MSDPSRPLVLLSNDDGYASRGLAVLRAALAERFDVVIVAPETEQSATSHSLSLHRPLRLREVEKTVFALDGTPADCVYVALNAAERLFGRAPRAVVSGINHGLNLGQDVFYSGTVAAAREGALRGLPAVASSAHPAADLAAVGALTAALTQSLLDRRAEGERSVRGPLLNLNVPRRWNGALRATHLGERIYDQGIEFRTDPRGRDYLWLGGPGGASHQADPGSDTEAYDAGAASVTPLLLDLTATGAAPLADGILRELDGRRWGARESS